MLRTILLLLGLLSLGGACKKQDPEPLKPTLLTVQVIYQQTQQPVDSALVVISGTKGGYLIGQQIQTFLQGYTDKQGRLQASILIPRDWSAVFVCGKNAKIGGQYKLYGVSSLQPYSDRLKPEQENNFVAQLDTLR